MVAPLLHVLQPLRRWCNGAVMWVCEGPVYRCCVASATQSSAASPTAPRGTILVIEDSMTRTRYFTLMTIAIVSCSKSDDRTSASKPSAPEPATARKAPKERPIDDLFGKQPAFPPQIANVKFGMTEAEVKAAAPTLSATFDVKPDDFHMVEISVRFSTPRRVNAVAIEAYEQFDKVKALLTSKWGTPKPASGQIAHIQRDFVAWSVPGMRASLWHSNNITTE